MKLQLNSDDKLLTSDGAHDDEEDSEHDSSKSVVVHSLTHTHTHMLKHSRWLYSISLLASVQWPCVVHLLYLASRFAGNC